MYLKSSVCDKYRKFKNIKKIPPCPEKINRQYPCINTYMMFTMVSVLISGMKYIQRDKLCKNSWKG